jgi:hypothetical protein
MEHPSRLRLFQAAYPVRVTKGSGYTAFEVPGGEKRTRLFLKTAREIIARGYDTNEGFVVVAGSKANKDHLPAATLPLRNLRNSVVECGVLVAEGDHFKWTQEYTFQLWDVSTRKNVATLNADNEPFFCVGFSPDGKRVAAGGRGNVIQLWENPVGKK